jgi:hypothetical protein
MAQSEKPAVTIIQPETPEEEFVCDPETGVCFIPDSDHKTKMKKKQEEIEMKGLWSEEGHINIGLATLLAGISIVILTWGAVNDDSTFTWIGGIGTAVFLLGQFMLVHAEFGKLWQRIDALEKN